MQIKTIVAAALVALLVPVAAGAKGEVTGPWRSPATATSAAS